MDEEIKDDILENSENPAPQDIGSERVLVVANVAAIFPIDHEPPGAHPLLVEALEIALVLIDEEH